MYLLARSYRTRRVTYNGNEDEKVIQPKLLHDEAAHKKAKISLVSPAQPEHAHTDRSKTKTTAMVY